jgi:hypothetical protein
MTCFNLVEIVYVCGYLKKYRFIFLCIKYFPFDTRAINVEVLFLDTEKNSLTSIENVITQHEKWAKI